MTIYISGNYRFMHWIAHPVHPETTSAVRVWIEEENLAVWLPAWMWVT